MLAYGHLRTVKSHHIRPDLVDIGAVGEVDHIRRKAAAGTHVDFQRNKLTLFTDMLVAGEAEKFEMNKTAGHAEALYRGTAESACVLRQLLQNVIEGIVVVVDNVHDRKVGDVACLKQRFSAGIDDSVVGIDQSVDKFLHDIGETAVAFGEEGGELLFVLQLVGSRRTDAVVGLDDDRPSDLFDKVQAALFIAHHMVPRGGNPRAAVVFLHGRLVFDARHILNAETGRDVEIAAQMGILFQPVLVVGLKKINPAVFEDEEGHCAVDLVVVLQRGDLVILRQAVFEFEAELVIRLVADAEDVYAVAAQLVAELPVIHREIRGDENDVFHNDFFLC